MFVAGLVMTDAEVAKPVPPDTEKKGTIDELLLLQETEADY